MPAANDSYERSTEQRFQGRAISRINERHHHIACFWTKEIIAQAEGDLDAFGSSRQNRHIASDERLTIRAYFQDYASGWWIHNDALRHCAM